MQRGTHLRDSLQRRGSPAAGPWTCRSLLRPAAFGWPHCYAALLLSPGFPHGWPRCFPLLGYPQGLHWLASLFPCSVAVPGACDLEMEPQRKMSARMHTPHAMAAIEHLFELAMTSQLRSRRVEEGGIIPCDIARHMRCVTSAFVRLHHAGSLYVSGEGGVRQGDSGKYIRIT